LRDVDGTAHSTDEVSPACCRFFFSSRRRHTRFSRDWSSDVCSSDLLLAGDLELFRGRRPEIVDGGAGDIRLRLDPALADLPDQGYRLLIDDQVRVLAADRSGLLHGSQSVAQLIKQDPDRRSLPRGAAFDHPRCSIRGQMIDVGRKFLPLDYLRPEIRRMAWLKLNSLPLHPTAWSG